MFRSLSPGAIGASVENLADGLDLAVRHGFAGYRLGLVPLALLGWWLSSRRKKEQLQSAESRLSEAEQTAEAAHQAAANAPQSAHFRGLLESQDHTGRPFALTALALGDRADVALGRSPANVEFVIDHEEVSREHGRLMCVDGELYAEDRADRNKLAHDPSVHDGVISRIEKGSWKERWYTKKFTIIQHSASTNPGNSGGPLLDDCGRAIGVNTGVSLDVTTDSSGAVIRESYATGLYWSSHIGELANLLDGLDIVFQSENGDCVAAGGTGSSGEAEKAQREAEKARLERVKTEEAIDQFFVQIKSFVWMLLLVVLVVLVVVLKPLHVKRNARPSKSQKQPHVKRNVRPSKPQKQSHVKRVAIACLVIGSLVLVLTLNKGKTPLHVAAFLGASSSERL